MKTEEQPVARHCPKEGSWRVLRRNVPMAGTVLQLAVFKWGKYIPMGPWADDVDEMRAEVDGMRSALDLPVLDESELPEGEVQ